MIWKRKLTNARKSQLAYLEEEILNLLIKELPEIYGSRIFQQLQYLKLIKRIEYDNDVITELYPTKFGEIPDSSLFERKEEFHLATILYKVKDIKYTCKIHMVLGQLFDMKIKPKPLSISDNIDFIDIKLERNLSNNVY